MVPNPAAIAAQNLYKIYRFTGEEKYFKIVGESIKKVSGLLDKSPLDVPSWFMLYYQMQEQNYEILISGKKEDNFYKESKSLILSSFIPNLIFCSSTGNRKELDLPIMKGRRNDNKTTVYICKNYVCNLPINNIKDLNNQLTKIVGVYK